MLMHITFENMKTRYHKQNHYTREAENAVHRTRIHTATANGLQQENGKYEATTTANMKKKPR